jgi:hypothetical protein
VLTGIFLGAAFLLALRIDINEFSMHHFYKNRLVRCYLGASRSRERKANWFTGFDPDDDLPLSTFDRQGKSVTEQGMKPYPGPYPVINCALNLVKGEDLAWQERKAEPFVFTPKYCGFDIDRAALTKVKSKLSSQAYVPTAHFFNEGTGPSLGMAMAISGAAANPNMGKVTSPASAFLMTVFNVRLGWWLGNPRRRKSCQLPGPGLGLPYTMIELSGGTNDRTRFVNVSDGGHFDNLGAYELIRRGCRYLVVSDAGQDGAFGCEDLGDLIRKCRTDFGVEIEICVDPIRTRDARGFSLAHCVVGTIHYLHIPKRNAAGDLVNDLNEPLESGQQPAHETGYLLYLKSSVTGDEPFDVTEYNARIPEFPHQSTGDQWFNESQFESYRTLGMHVGETAFERYYDGDVLTLSSMDELFRRLYKFWARPASLKDRNTHTRAYSELMERIRSVGGLTDMDGSLFSLTQPLPVANRNRFYVCNALIQLMEDVYVDLDLEQNWAHPYVEGWMSVFRSWVRTPPFVETWAVSGPTYAERFRDFYNDRLM